ncbi:MAG TPA: sigma-70 family RNA polymerase sigma factor [Terriglobales bacterium]|jgi:RNA polymerase sigma factor (sigma-70 family)|nr:sigma-70 family RNA polymerase sigma factor [Terriglobales bacterium]
MTHPTSDLRNNWRAEDLGKLNCRSATSKQPPARTSSHSAEPVAATGDAHLVSECLKGSEDAWAALIHKYKRLMYSIPIKYGARPADAADIVQSVCMELFCELSNLRKVESLKSWLMVVTARKSFHWKKSNRMEMTLDNVERDYPEAIAMSSAEIVEAEKEQCLREAVAQLPARCQELVRLLFYEQPPIPYAEVARRLGLATGSIGFTRGRCLARLQKILTKMGF